MFKRLTDYLQGRHTTFAIFFALSGSFMQWFHHLDGNYIALITAVQGLVLAHSAQENYFSAKGPTDGGDKA
jgi:hypothetical protein